MNLSQRPKYIFSFIDFFVNKKGKDIYVNKKQHN